MVITPDTERNLIQQQQKLFVCNILQNMTGNMGVQMKLALYIACY